MQPSNALIINQSRVDIENQKLIQSTQTTYHGRNIVTISTANQDEQIYKKSIGCVIFIGILILTGIIMMSVCDSPSRYSCVATGFYMASGGGILLCIGTLYFLIKTRLNRPAEEPTIFG